MRKILWIVILIVILGSVYYFVMKDRGEDLESNERAVEGTVVLVDTSQVPADGPAIVTLREDDGDQVLIYVRSMGINLCPAQPNILDVYSLATGTRVEVRGQVEGNTIVPCESYAHYLRVVR